MPQSLAVNDKSTVIGHAMRRVQMAARQTLDSLGWWRAVDGSPSVRTGEVPVLRRIKAAKASLTSTAGAKDDRQPGPSMITLPVLPNATGASWSGCWRGMVNCEVGCKMVVRWVLLAIEPCMCHRQCPRNAPPSRVSSPALMPSHAGAITSKRLLTPRTPNR